MLVTTPPAMHHPLWPYLIGPFRSLESHARSGWLRLALGALTRHAGPLPDWDDGPRRVLFIRHDGIGDLIMSTGILRAMVAAHPSLVVDVLTSPDKAAVLENLPFVDRVLVHERGGGRSWLSLLRELRSRRYDAVIDGAVGRPSVNSYTARLLIACGARWRIGSSGRLNDFMFNVPVAPPACRQAEHHVAHLARLAAPFGLGAAAADWRPVLALTRDERLEAWHAWRNTPGRGQLVLVNLSAGSAERRWPDERFVALLARLRDRAPLARIIIVGLPHDRESVARLAQPAGALTLIPSVRQLIALVATADLVISPDTAVTHAASAFQRPTLALMRRREEFEMWTPYHTPGVCVFGDDPLTLNSLPTARVLSALDIVLEQLDAASSELGRAARAYTLPARVAQPRLAS
jgi:ADP-heptose:LPS heptosyltransferase